MNLYQSVRTNLQIHSNKKIKNKIIFSLKFFFSLLFSFSFSLKSGSQVSQPQEKLKHFQLKLKYTALASPRGSARPLSHASASHSGYASVPRPIAFPL